ncbi:MAG: redoxin domain-containing protein [Verrucomicrobiales bacterium]|nr:redoxin domain-containing protein [Verrucomicrobiales bacterium]
MTTNHKPQSSRRLLWWLLGMLVVSIVLAVTLARPLQDAYLRWSLLNAETASDELFDTVVANSPSQEDLLVAAWNTGKITHRQLVIDRIKRRAGSRDPLNPSLEKLLLDGALDVDMNVREMALGALATAKHPALPQLAARQLSDPDPQVRLLGLQHLSRLPIAQGLPVAIRLLDDPDLKVAASAESALRRWTQLDFGVRVRDTIGKRDEKTEVEVLEPEKEQKVRAGIEKWKLWWTDHQNEFPSKDLVATAAQPPSFGRLPLSDFSAQELSGKRIRLSDYRGKTLLLNFWTTWCTACLMEIPDLVELRRRRSHELAIVGVSLDYVPDSHGHIGGHGSQADDDHDHAGHEHGDNEQPPLAKIRAKVEKMVKARKMDYAVVLDSKNELGGRFNGGELPTNVLIDANGFVRRRFIGTRPPAVWEAMLAEIKRNTDGQSN